MARIRLNSVRHPSAVAFATVLLVAGFTASTLADEPDEKAKKPSIVLKASPRLAFSPARIVATAELRGGPDDYEAFYCPDVEWEWGDGTYSESRNDCAPYEAGTSEIKRRYTTSHTFTTAGNYKVVLRLKRGKKTVASANTNVQVKPGARDLSQF